MSVRDVPAERVDDGSVRVTTWRVLGTLTLLFIAVTLLVFRQTIFDMADTWYTSRTFSHCLLVFPLFVYLLWSRRGRLAGLSLVPNLSGLFALAILAIMWLLGNIGEVKVVQEFALVAILITIAWTFLGSDVVRAFRFPLAFLFFAVPFGLGLIGPLQDATAWFAVHALTLSGIPAVLEHRSLSVPSATWTVAEACSGIRYIFSSVMTGVIYASIVYRSRRRRLLFVCASILVPVVANGLRAYLVVVLAYLTNNRLAAGVDHIVYGWVFFSVVQLALFAVGLRWRQISAQPIAGAVNSPAARSAPHRVSLASTVVAATGAAVLLGFAPLLAQHLWNRAATSAGRAWAEPPVLVRPPWQTVSAFDTNWAPDLRGADKDFIQSYVAGQRRFDLYWAHYSGRQGFELLNSYNRLTNPKVWAVVGDNFENQVIDGQPIRVHRSLIESGPLSRSVWTWYWVNGEYTGSPARVKFLQAKARLFGASAETVVLAVGADSPLGSSAVEPNLADFLSRASFLTKSSPEPLLHSVNNSVALP